jgi:hypothetical protein
MDRATPEMPLCWSEPIREVWEVMRGYDAPWFVGGGWAVDLFLGRQTRTHDDIDLVVFRDDQHRLREHLRAWQVMKVIDGTFDDWREDQWLALPVHEIHAYRPDAHPSKLEFLLNERYERQWVFRRSRRVTLDMSRLGSLTTDAIPVLCPEVVLLYKAKSVRPTDQHDFEMLHSLLDARQRQWLSAALRVCHPGHPWIACLSDSRPC